MLRLKESKENNIFSHPILGCKRHGEKREIGAKIIYEMYWLTCYSSYFIELNDHTVSFFFGQITQSVLNSYNGLILSMDMH